MAEGMNAAEIAAAQKLNDLTGMELPIEVPQSEDAPAEKPEPAPAAKPEEGKAADKGKGDDKGTDNGEGGKEVEPERPARVDRPLKAVFTQIKELRALIEPLVKATGQKPEATAAQIDDAIKSVAEKRNLDPEGLADIVSMIETRLIGKLKDGAFQNDPKLKEALETIEVIKTEQKEKAEGAYFETEWAQLQPELQKQFPNAGANEIAEAKKLMDEISHSKDHHNHDLDYILFKNRSKFETILKVAKAKKAGETEGSKQIADDVDPGKDIDLDPENMTPEKFKAYQKQKFADQKDEPVQMMGA